MVSHSGGARTRGVAQVTREFTGGAEPPPHIRRQSRAAAYEISRGLEFK